MRYIGSMLALAGSLALAACSSDPGYRAIEGAGIGGAAGAVGAAVVGGSVVTGAAVGAAAGAVVGAVTDEGNLDLGKGLQ